MATEETKATVYVVDDDEVIRGVFMSLVEMMGLAGEQYRSAEEFLAAYQPAGPACVILDMELPGMNGLQLQAELKRRAWALPVVLVTGFGAERIEREALRQGAVAVIEKPCRAKEMSESIEKAIELVRKA